MPLDGTEVDDPRGGIICNLFNRLMIPPTQEYDTLRNCARWWITSWTLQKGWVWQEILKTDDQHVASCRLRKVPETFSSDTGGLLGLQLV